MLWFVAVTPVHPASANLSCSLAALHPRPTIFAMADARILHDIASALRALQIRAVESGSAIAQAHLAMAISAIHDLAIKAEKESAPLATTPAEMMRRLEER
ncbi:MAG: hypothetical protein ACRYGP_08115 [Janthinobacterium lividum]